ncbi:hypothetical protein B0H11DRAFT_17357 [Mycena galericulata]|nr:hypothetical protein B0H11DRAFT_17357 [Mycena galericulata]
MFLPFFTTPLRLSRRAGSSSSSSSGGRSGSSSSSSGSKGGSSSSTGKGTSSSSSSSKGGSSSSSGKSGSTGSSSGTKGGSSSSGKSTSISSGGTTRTITSYNNGGGKTITIPSGNLFAGRTEGGATRGQIWGNRGVGSGYPGYYSRGVSDRGFPFYFWPMVWATDEEDDSDSSYMYTNEYGQPDNTTRPGGPQAIAVFQSNSTGTTFRVVSDNSTVAALMSDISANCSSWLIPSSITNFTTTLPTPFNVSAAPAEPEQVVQYYRASSVALTLDGYNNSAVYAPENSTTDTPLPAGIDTNLLECLNATIGLAVPLVGGAPGRPALSAPGVGILALVVLLRALL